MSDRKLTNEEQEILTAFEAGKFKSLLTPARKKYLEMVATGILSGHETQSNAN